MDAQTSLFDLAISAPVTNHSAALDNDPDSFGCCSRYRDCSSSHQCLIPDREYSIHCVYRQNLEQGRTFYGKSADWFSTSQYAEIQRRVDLLSPTSRSIFDCVLIDLCEFHRGTNRTMIRKDSVSDLQTLGLFDFQLLRSAFPKFCSYQVLKSAVSDHPRYGFLFRQAQVARSAELAPLREAKKAAKNRGDKAESDRLDRELKQLAKSGKPGENTKEFLIQWMNTDGAALRDEMADPYRFACVLPTTACYIEEFYRDTLFLSYDDGRIYDLSPLTADGWRTLYDWEEDELRRVKLSHGYSPEEKSFRVSEIENARAVRAAERRKKKAALQQNEESEE